MRVLGCHRLEELLNDGDTRTWVRSWVAELRTARWFRPEDIRRQYPSAEFVGADHFSFRIPGTEHSVSIQVAFSQGIALILGS